MFSFLFYFCKESVARPSEKGKISSVCTGKVSAFLLSVNAVNRQKRDKKAQ